MRPTKVTEVDGYEMVDWVGHGPQLVNLLDGRATAATVQLSFARDVGWLDRLDVGERVKLAIYGRNERD
jgi:hypothetical protein